MNFGLWLWETFGAKGDDYVFPKGVEQMNFHMSKADAAKQDHANRKRNMIEYLYTHAPEAEEIKWKWNDAEEKKEANT